MTNVDFFLNLSYKQYIHNYSYRLEGWIQYGRLLVRDRRWDIDIQ